MNVPKSLPSHSKKNLSGELKINFGFISTLFKKSEEKTSIYQKLISVEKYIEKYHSVGSIDSPEEYFRGSLNMKWGVYGMNWNDYGSNWKPIKEIGQIAQAVYFAGETKSTIIGLGGSTYHLIGNRETEKYDRGLKHSASGTPFLLSILYEELGLTTFFELMKLPFNEISKSIAIDATTLATLNMDGPSQNLEFLAKRLLCGKSYESERKVILGSPIYVALDQ